MNTPELQPRGTTRLARASLLGCTVIALANLPVDDFPIGWLLALVVPGAALGRLPTATAPWRRALVTVLLQVLALWLALEFAGRLSRPAALACTILPPLAFVTARQQESDGALGLFLGFCVLLVGVILDGVHVPLLLAYGLVACVTLRTTAHLAACRVSRAPHGQAVPRRTANVLGSALALALPCLLAAFAVERTIVLMPSPNRTTIGTAGGGDDSGRRRVGLDDRFELDGGTGMLSNLHGEQLVRVRSSTGEPVPRDLYLRSGFFAKAGLDRWQIGALAQTPAPDAAAHRLRRPLPGAEVEWLELERFAGARNFVFAPPGTTELHGLEALLVDDLREWLRQPAGSTLVDDYALAYQRLPSPPADLPLDPRAATLGLLALPATMQRAPFQRLLDAWGVARDPQTAAEAIAAGLATHCRYDRIEPPGPYGHALENFLFADGDRRGYCMHFASAAALLLRLRGIACRIGVGLYGGEVDRNEPGARLYGSQHAHAWVEIPYAGRGYVVFDPTPPQERGQRMPSRLDDRGRLDPAPNEAAATAVAPWRAVLDFLLQPWLLLSALLLAIGSALWPTGPARRAAPVLPPVARSARRLLARLLRALAAAGHTRRDGDTLELFARELAARGRLLPEIQRAFEVYQEVRFGGRPFDDTRAADLQRAALAAERLPPQRDTAQAKGSAGQT